MIDILKSTSRYSSYHIFKKIIYQVNDLKIELKKDGRLQIGIKYNSGEYSKMQ